MFRRSKVERMSKEEAAKRPVKLYTVSVESEAGTEIAEQECVSALGAFAKKNGDTASFCFMEHQPSSVIEETIDALLHTIVELATKSGGVLPLKVAASLIAAGYLVLEMQGETGLIHGVFTPRFISRTSGEDDARAGCRVYNGRDLMRMMAEVQRETNREQARQDTQGDPLFDFLKSIL